MFKNNIRIALRSLLKQKVYTLINVMGLAVGVASCLLIVLFVQDEFSYDKFFTDHERIYKMALERIYPNHASYYASIPHSFGEVAKKDFPEIEESTNLFDLGNVNILYKDDKDERKQFEEEFASAGDSNFFKMFNFKMLKGDRANALRQANEAILTEDAAKKYFGDSDPIGKTISIPGAPTLDFKVTGVCENVPENSHMKFAILLSANTFPFVKEENFRTFECFTYFKLKPGTTATSLEAKFPKMVDTYAAAQIERDLGKSWTDYVKEGNGYRYFLQPLAGIHLDPTNIEGQMKVGGSITTVYIMISVAILILVIACINFMNLATARSSERAKEVGVRKTMGSFRQQLMMQFLTESFVLSLTGVVLAVVLIQASLPFFNNLTGKDLHLILNPLTLGGLLLTAVFVGFLAGIYPSFILSSFNPVVVMKGTFTSSSSGKWIRSGLVIFQFWISIILMIGTLVIYQQMKFMREKSLGFDKEQVLLVERAFNLDAQKLKTITEEIKRMPEVISTSSSFAMPGKQGDFFGSQFQTDGSSEILTTKTMIVSDGLTETLGMELKEGRWFSEETKDSLSIMLNEATVKVMGLENPVGKKLFNMRRGPKGNVMVQYTITGVIKDFNFQSLHDQITPLVIQSNEGFGRGGQYIMARVKADQVASAIASIETKWKELVPEQQFRFSFLDENINALYKGEQQTGRLFTVFAGLAIFVACIGLFALSAYTASLRTKEIGVRKVLGASVGGVVFLLSKDFTKMILVSFVLAVPVAWYVMENWWLSNFAYRIHISLWIILASGACAFMIAWLTVSYQSIKAAIKNPVRSLRSE